MADELTQMPIESGSTTAVHPLESRGSLQVPQLLTAAEAEAAVDRLTHQRMTEQIVIALLAQQTGTHGVVHGIQHHRGAAAVAWP